MLMSVTVIGKAVEPSVTNSGVKLLKTVVMMFDVCPIHKCQIF